MNCDLCRDIFISVYHVHINCFLRYLDEDLEGSLQALNPIGMSLLMCCCARSRTHDFARILIERGAEINFQNENPHPLFYVVNSGQLDMANFLIERGSQVNIFNERYFCPLSLSVWNLNFEITQLFLKNGADPNVTDSDGNSILFLLCSNFGRARYDHQKRIFIEIVELLLQFGANPFSQNNKGVSAYSIVENTQYGDLSEEIRNIFENVIEMKEPDFDM